MDASEDKNWAKKYLLDPLNEPEPSAETGPGAHFKSSFAPATLTATPPPAASGKESSVATREKPIASPVSTNPFRRASLTSPNKNTASTEVRPVGGSSKYPTPPSSASPRHERFPNYREQAFSDHQENPPRQRRSVDHGSSSGPSSPKNDGRPRRTSSLSQRYPGDKSHRPLDMLKDDNKAANRSPHLRKKHMPGADTIDKLDSSIVGSAYHHEGPYDATLLARNTSLEMSPIAAVSRTNEEALKATPRENIQDSIERHRPLDGVATIPPGEHDRFGRTYNYEEGANQMIEGGGNYKRWPGVEYLPDDIKGKGEPSYSLDKALKEHRISGDPNDGQGIEMVDRPKRATGVDPVDVAGGQSEYVDMQHEVRRRDSTKQKIGDGLKKRIGSLRRKNKD